MVQMPIAPIYLKFTRLTSARTKTSSLNLRLGERSDGESHICIIIILELIVLTETIGTSKFAWWRGVVRSHQESTETEKLFLTTMMTKNKTPKL